jgi:hypothetical protein
MTLLRFWARCSVSSLICGRSTGSKIDRGLKLVIFFPSNKKRTSVIFPCPCNFPDESVCAKVWLRKSINIECSSLYWGGTKFGLNFPIRLLSVNGRPCSVTIPAAMTYYPGDNECIPTAIICSQVLLTSENESRAIAYLYSCLTSLNSILVIALTLEDYDERCDHRFAAAALELPVAFGAYWAVDAPSLFSFMLRLSPLATASSTSA